MDLKTDVLFLTVSELLYTYDFVGLNLGHNPGEYDTQAWGIIDKLHRLSSAEAVGEELYRMFYFFFDGEDLLLYKRGDERYTLAGAEILGVWRDFNTLSDEAFLERYHTFGDIDALFTD